MKSSCEELIRKTSPIIGQIVMIITSGVVLSRGKMEEGWCEGHMDEGARPHLDVKPTFYIEDTQWRKVKPTFDS